MVAVVDELEAAGFVERQRNPDDRRAYALEATAAGRAWLAEKRGALMAAQDELLSVLARRRAAHAGRARCSGC